MAEIALRSWTVLVCKVKKFFVFLKITKDWGGEVVILQRKSFKSSKTSNLLNYESQYFSVSLR